MLATKVADNSLKMNEIKQKAKTLGINPENMKKTDLIRAMQAKEGYTPCFGTSNGQCSQTSCCFRSDCLKIRS
jgi:hypothetical protein